MPRALRAVAPAILALAASALGVALAPPSMASYGYDAVGMQPGSDVAAAPATRGEVGLWLDEVDRDLAMRSYDDSANLARASARPEGYRLAPNTATRHVIGGMEDLGPGSLQAGESTVASRLSRKCWQPTRQLAEQPRCSPFRHAGGPTDSGRLRR